MTDDLARRLREVGGLDPAAELCSYAADRIKELEAQVVRLRAAIDDVASYVSLADYYYMEPQTLEVIREARAALEGKDD